MSRYNHIEEVDVWKALVVQAQLDGVDALDYIAHRSRADPTEVEA